MTNALEGAPAAYIGLGANLGDAPAALRAAVHGLAGLPQTRVLAVSSLWRSAPVDSEGPDFTNAVAAIATRLEPHALLAALQALEAGAGRQRPWRNAPRTLDLDILHMDGVAVDDALLTLPHPRWRQRAFVLRPLAEVAPALVAPAWLDAVGGQRIERLPGSWWLPGAE